MSNKVIEGYQYGDGNVFIGTYVFEDNMDKIEVHLPPRTTLQSPPVIPSGYEAIWDGFNWFIRPVEYQWLGILSPDGEKEVHPLTPEMKEKIAEKLKTLHPPKSPQTNGQPQ